MEPGGIGIILVLFVLLALSAFFSSTETAFSSVSHTRLKSRAKLGDRKAQLGLDLAEDYDRLLSTILIGNNIVNLLASSLATVEFVFFYKDAGVTIATAVMTILVLIFGEISPNTLAKDRAEQMTVAIAPVVS